MFWKVLSSEKDNSPTGRGRGNWNWKKENWLHVQRPFL